MNETVIKSLATNGQVYNIKIKYPNSPPWWIEVTNTLIPHARFNGSDLFDCLIKLRSELDKLNIKLLCNGSRIDAHPSRMSRDMGGARKVYLLKIGQQGRLEDLVDIFDEASADKVSTVEEQNIYYRNWIKSLG